MIKLLIADDHQQFIDGLRSLLEKQSNMEIIGCALNGQEVVEVLSQRRADVILLDLKMPNTDIIALVHQLRLQHPTTRILILTMYHGADYFEELVKIGIGGYLFKSVGTKELLTAIQEVHEGRVVYTQEFATGVSSIDQEQTSTKEDPKQLLTRRELDILELIAKKYSNQEIADKMLLSLNTVAVHYNNIILKLGVKDHASLLHYCYLTSFLKN